jgi:hypothetical protein
MYINGKIVSVETISVIGREDKENGGGVNSNMIYLSYMKYDIFDTL